MSATAVDKQIFLCSSVAIWVSELAHISEHAAKINQDFIFSIYIISVFLAIYIVNLDRIFGLLINMTFNLLINVKRRIILQNVDMIYSIFCVFKIGQNRLRHEL
jgi:hypothetical protein